MTTALDFILSEVKDERIVKIAKLAYALGFQEAINLQPKQEEELPSEFINERFTL